MSLSSFQDKNAPWLFLIIPISLIAGILLLYQVIVQEKSIILFGIIAVLFFIICFSSIRLSLILLIFSMLLSPEIGVAQTVGREVAIRFDDILLFIMTISWLARMAVFSDLGIILKNPLNKPIIAYSLLAIASTILGAMYGGVNPAVGFFFVFKIIEYFFLFTIIVNYVRKEEDIHQLLSSLLIVFGIICLYGLFMVITGGDISAPFEGEKGERNTLGGYLVLMASVAAGVMLHTPSKLEKTLIASILPVFFVVLLFSISRSGWVSGVTALIILFVCTKKKGVFFALVLGVLLIFPFVVPEVVQERFNFTFFQESYFGSQIKIGPFYLDTSTSARIFSYKLVLNHLLKHPFFGFGVTGFGFIDGQFFRVLIEMGVLGLASFLWLLFGVHGIIRKGMKAEFSPRLKGMAVGFYAGFWALMIHAITANTFIIVRIAEPFWCLAGLIVAFSYHQAANSNLLEESAETSEEVANEIIEGET